MQPLLSSDRLPARFTAGITLFVLSCLLSSFHLIHSSPNPRHISFDDIAARSDQPFAAVRTQLPNRGIIGYIGESGNSGTADYYLAQYALAPLVLDRSPNHSLVIGSFPTSSPQFPENLHVIRDFGNGVMLFAVGDAK
jgi:hypothetical protein